MTPRFLHPRSLRARHDRGALRARGWTLATLALLVTYASLGVALVGDYGITFDEGVHNTNGENVLAWYTSGFTDRAFLTFSNLRYYGVLFDLPPVVVHRITGADLWLIRHFYAFGFALFAVAGIARLARLLDGPAAGFFAALALILTPRFFGHGFNNGKDIPLAACTVWAVAAAIRFAQRLPRPGWKRILELGVTWGLALAVRMSALSIAAIVGIAAATWWWTRDRRPSWLSTASALAPSLAAVAIIAAVIMIPFWPLLQVRPVLGLPLAIRDQFRAGGTLGIPMLYFGEVIRHLDAPAGYVWAWLVRITPEFYAVALGLACAGALRSRPWREKELIGWTAVAAAAGLPFILATLTRPNLYDELRHFLFATVFLAVPAGAGIAWSLRARELRVVRAAGLLLIVASLALTVTDLVRLHPYQTAWFNRSVAGGLSGAAGQWDTDYWGNAFREGALWLVANVPPGSPPPRVASSASRQQTEPYLPPDRFTFVGSVDEPPHKNPYEDPPDYYLGFTRWGGDRLYPGEVLYRVSRDGVTFLVVVKVDRDAAMRLSAPQSNTK